MSNSKLKTDFTLSIKEHVMDSHPPHRHNYFELIYVLEGRGIHAINENQFTYAKGDLFLLTPTDSHTLEAHAHSTFCMIDFTASFFGRSSPTGHDKPELSHFFKQLEYIFQNAVHYQGYVNLDDEDKMFAALLIKRLITEWEQNGYFREIILQNVVFLLLNLIARYAQTPGASPARENIAYEMTQYVQHHIYDNERIRLERIAEHFHFSRDYAGAYFRKHTGKTVKQFILDYKLELVKTRLSHSRLTISQIAEELGFTDDSHLNKVFRKQVGMTAKQYRIRKL